MTRRSRHEIREHLGRLQDAKDVTGLLRLSVELSTDLRDITTELVDAMSAFLSAANTGNYKVVAGLMADYQDRRTQLAAVNGITNIVEAQS